MSHVLQKLSEAARLRWGDTPFAQPEPPALAETPPVQLVPVASGKGGVGKTNISVGISIAAGLQFEGTGKRVLLIDGDIGLPNTDLILGARPERTLMDLVGKEIDEIHQLVSPTRYPGLDFIAGAEEATLILGNLYYQQRQRMMGQISALRASLIVFDLGASASKETLDFFAMSLSGILVLNPEPTSIRDAYVFLKNAVLRRIRNDLTEQPDVRDEFDRLLETHRYDWKRLREILPQLASAELQRVATETLERFRPMLVLNRVAAFAEGLATARKFTKDVEQFLGVRCLYLGAVVHDEAVMRAVKTQRPFRIAEPHCKASQCIDAVTKNLLNADGIDLRNNFASFGRIIASRITGRPV